MKKPTIVTAFKLISRDCERLMWLLVTTYWLLKTFNLEAFDSFSDKRLPPKIVISKAIFYSYELSSHLLKPTEDITKLGVADRFQQELCNQLFILYEKLLTLIYEVKSSVT